MPRACPEPALNGAEGPSRRGGRRPGAGAKPGNLNALKHGRTSAQLEALAAFVARHPRLRQIFIRYNRRLRKQQRQAERGAAHLLQQLLQRAAANDRTFVPILDSLRAQNHETSSKPSTPQSPASKRSNYA